MERYIGVKVVHAEPAFKINGRVYLKNWPIPIHEEEECEDGYKVVYPDGYESWSPKDVFEEAYRETTGLTFGLAIEAAKKGKRIARHNWNGKNQYVELATCISYKNNAGDLVNVDHCAIGNAALAFVGTSGVQMGWLASQADILAEDWYIVD